VSDAPLILCSGGTEETVVTPDGKVVRTLPKTKADRRNGEPSAANTLPFRYTLDVTNFGLEPGERLNMETGERVDLYLGNDFAIARFADGAIERFGQRDTASAFLYCDDRGELLPWSACASTADIRDRF
jgi:hypothetical protein